MRLDHSLGDILDDTKKISVNVPTEQFHFDKTFETASEEAVDIHKDFGYNSVGQIFNMRTQTNILQPFAPGPSGECRGSGFLVKVDGETLMVTNHHVVDQFASLKVAFPAFGKEHFTATVFGDCPEKDLALLKINIEDSKVCALEFANSDNISTATRAIAVGFPLGMEGQKITSGVISGYETLGSQVLIQTDVALNPGNSGGCLCNERGHVLGVNSSIIRGKNNVGYAIPAKTVQTFIRDVKHLMKQGATTPVFVSRPVLGAFCQKSNENITKYLKNPKDGGYYVSYILPGSLLDKRGQGLQKGDQICAINGQKVDMYGQTHVEWSTTPVSMFRVFDRLSLGEGTEVSVYRNGKRVNVNISYNKCDPRVVKPMFFPYDKIDYEIFAGMVVQQLSQNHVGSLMRVNPLLSAYLLPNNLLKGAVIVTHVFPGSNVQQQRTINIGNVIKTINGVEIHSVNDFRNVFRTQGSNEFFSITTDFNRDVLLSRDEIKADENMLPKMFHFTPSDLIMSLNQTEKLNQVSQLMQGDCGCGSGSEEEEVGLCIGKKIAFAEHKKGPVSGTGIIVKIYPSGRTVKIKTEGGELIKKRVYTLRKIPSTDEVEIEQAIEQPVEIEQAIEEPVEIEQAIEEPVEIEQPIDQTIDQTIEQEATQEEEEEEEIGEVVLSESEIVLLQQQLGCTHLSRNEFLDMYKDM